MKILIVEDSKDKRDNIIRAVEKHNINVSIDICESVRGAIEAIDSDNSFDLILLDMSLPLFDITDDVPDGGDSESFGGHEIIQQMSFLKILSPVVVITHYRTFHGGITYEALNGDLNKSFPDIVLGMIYYDHPSNEWINELNKYLNDIGKQ